MLNEAIESSRSKLGSYGVKLAYWVEGLLLNAEQNLPRREGELQVGPKRVMITSWNEKESSFFGSFSSSLPKDTREALERRILGKTEPLSKTEEESLRQGFLCNVDQVSSWRARLRITGNGIVIKMESEKAPVNSCVYERLHVFSPWEAVEDHGDREGSQGSVERRTIAPASEAIDNNSEALSVGRLPKPQKRGPLPPERLLLEQLEKEQGRDYFRRCES